MDVYYSPIQPLFHSRYISNRTGIVTLTAPSCKKEKDLNTETYTIVGPEEVNPSVSKISYNAPIAKQLLHAKTGDTITLTTPAGNHRVKILEIS